jgi:IclR family pca regulon transcriptional regulator
MPMSRPELFGERSDVEDVEDEDQKTAGNVRSRDFIQSLQRGLAIIRAFSAQRPSMTVSEIAQEIGLTRAAARRFLLTLNELGYVRATNNRYTLTPQVLELGYSYLSALSLPDIALPRLDQLVAETGEASEASILDGAHIVYVVRVPGPAMMTISVNIGARRPAYATAMGRVMLADLPADQLEQFLHEYPLHPILPSTITGVDEFRAELAQVRRDGYALVNQELEEGLVAVAVPVRDRLGRVRAAINLSTHVGRRSAEDMRALVPVVTAAANDIEIGLKYAPNWRD